MGVPKFFRYISERYPCLSELVREEKIPEFDNLYLDMNGIIHNCSHPDDSNIHFRITEENMFKDIFNYIDKLFFLIKPKKLFFMAVDGVAPRAKMNQQRSRRFRSAKEAEILEKNAEKRGEKLPDAARFDSNCITPGTEFMERLQNALKYFVKSKISTNPLWHNCRIILSGHETPGEGEHKIMEYIRFLKSQSNYDENTRHCLYGLDADLIILGLCTHEIHFSLLREEVSFGKKAKKAPVEETRFFLLHLTLLRDYLELEFITLKETYPEHFDIDRIIDDWILMGFLVGNDFIPNLPNFHINSNALPMLYNVYRKVWSKMGGYINENGKLNLERFEKFMECLGDLDEEMFSETCSDLKYLETKSSKSNFIPEAFDINIEDIKTNRQDLDELIQENNMLFDSSDSDYNSSTEDYSSRKEFVSHKRNYYIKKLNYCEMTPQVLSEQTKCYITALQWILFYYYRGVPSWSWFYPHHYAPFASDIKDFKELSIDFNLGTPFLPFQQLLAVLPSASKELLPVAFQHLMLDQKSKLIQYYPTDFQTDLNGKKQEWEAVVLIPFIDEDELIKAMETCLKDLTENEVNRNIHGPMLQYDYIDKSQGECPGINSMKPIRHVFCTERKVWRKDIAISENYTSTNINKRKSNRLHYLGFPTMKHLKYSSELKKTRVKVFDQPTRNESMILLPENIYKTATLEDISNKFLNKIVYIGWPHLTQAKIIAISNETTKIDHNGCQINDSRVFNSQMRGIQEHNLCRMGIDFQEITTIIHAVTLVGLKYVHKSQGDMTLTQIWNDIEICYPVQGVVSDINVYKQKLAKSKKIEDEFLIGTKIFLLSSPYFGCEGQVLDPLLVYSCGRIKVAITVLPEPDFTIAKLIQKEAESQYIPSYQTSAMTGLSANCLGRITSSLFVIPGVKRRLVTDNISKINIGLKLKFPRCNNELVGYSRKVKNVWMFSQKAIELIISYYEKFPQIFDAISISSSYDTYFESELFPTEECTLNDVSTWLKAQEHTKSDRVPCGTKTVEKEVIEPMIEAIEQLKTRPVKSVKLQVKPYLVLKPESNNLEPYRPKNLRLFDRVVVVKNTYQVPAGSKGTIVAIHPVSDPNPVRLECVKTVETFYEILFDKELLEGHAIHGLAEGRISKISENCILTIFQQQNEFSKQQPQLSATNSTSKMATYMKNDKSKISNNPELVKNKYSLEQYFVRATNDDDDIGGSSSTISNLKSDRQLLKKDDLSKNLETISNTRTLLSETNLAKNLAGKEKTISSQIYFNTNLKQDKNELTLENNRNQKKSYSSSTLFETTKKLPSVENTGGNILPDNIYNKNNKISQQKATINKNYSQQHLVNKNTNQNYVFLQNGPHQQQQQQQINNFRPEFNIDYNLNGPMYQQQRQQPQPQPFNKINFHQPRDHHTDVLKLMLGLQLNQQTNNQAWFNFQQQNPNVTHLPPPPTQWTNDAWRLPHNRLPLNNTPHFENNTMSYKPQLQAHNHSQIPSNQKSTSDQMYSKNISSGGGAFIPIQTIKKDGKLTEVIENFKTIEMNPRPPPIENIKKKVSKPRIPKIAARFDFKGPPQ